ncbi:MAG: stage II sporulation protein M [Acidihalobacter sp.]|uniref:stage II sporulation protein M n=1 Tax=Acidihalobacter sp. TaxID=1872108 RepID=UPI00307D3CAA
MKQEQFVQGRRPAWELLRRLLDQLEKPSRRREAAPLEQLPELYRQVCADYALARHRSYSSALVDELHGLTLRGHRQLYRRKSLWWWRAVRFVRSEFPRTLRRNARLFWLASALFYLPAVVMGGLCYHDGDFIYTVMSSKQVSRMEYMYDPANSKLGRSQARESSTDVQMFGYYVWNNIGIGFRTFASGIVFGLGPLLLLLFNGVTIGSVAGHLTQLGFLGTFWPFVAGHSAFELTAICISGTAGLMLARALLAPGRRSRAEALRAEAHEAVKLVMGAALMLLVAACIEAFWSGDGAIAPPVKFAAAALLWLAVILYLSLAGRDQDGA